MNPPLLKRTPLGLPRRTRTAGPASDDQVAETATGSFMEAVLAEAEPAAPSEPSDDTGALAASVRRWMVEASEAADPGPASAPRSEQADDHLPPPAPSRRDRRTAVDDSTSRDRPATAGIPTRHRVAVLIAADAFDASDVPSLLATVTDCYARPAITRVYADWTGTNPTHEINAWSQAVKQHGVQPIHTMSPGAAATSVALSLDALDAVTLFGLTCVVLAGEPAELRPLATRLRARGVHVVTVSHDPDPSEQPCIGDDHIAIRPPAVAAEPDAATSAHQPGRHRKEATAPPL